jgi:phosphate transport system permease protein
MASPKRGVLGEHLFGGVVKVAGIAVLGLLAVLFLALTYESLPAIIRFGLSFVFGSVWDPLHDVFGVLPMIYGSFVTSAIALLVGVPVSIGVAVFLSELCPPRLRTYMSFVVELLAAIPSVVYGLWALFILAPLLRLYVYPALQAYLGFLPIFQGTIYGVGVLTAGLILAVMIIPIVASVSRDAMAAVPGTQREAAYALGMTRSEAISTSVIGYARSGIIASVFLGFGRAFGETMAVKMVIGDTPLISSSLFSPGYTLAAVIANEFTDAISPIFRDSLVEAGLVLLVISFASNVVARLLIRRFVKERSWFEHPA